MSKKQRKREFGLPKEAIVERVEQSLGRFIAPPCPMCKNIELPNRRSTFVNGTEKRLNSDVEMITSRLIKCTGCGHTWMDYEIIKHRVDPKTVG